jgi:hypothetical protein
MTQVVDLIKWCFHDSNSGIYTIIVLMVIFGGIVEIIKAFKGTD